jgi:hypothetical protein
VNFTNILRELNQFYTNSFRKVWRQEEVILLLLTDDKIIDGKNATEPTKKASRTKK